MFVIFSRRTSTCQPPVRYVQSFPPSFSKNCTILDAARRQFRHRTADDFARTLRDSRVLSNTTLKDTSPAM